jgi:hypothetical protein
MDIRAEVADEMAAELQATQQMYQAVLLQQSKAHEEKSVFLTEASQSDA